MPATDTPLPVDLSGVPAWRVRLGQAGGVFLGAVFLLAALTKAIDPVAFAELIEVEGLDFLLPARLLAPLVVALEVALGLALLLGVRRLWVLLPAAALVLFFLFITGSAYYQSVHGADDPATSCGCFGNLVERTPAEAFWQDLLLMVPALALAFLGRRPGARFPRRRVIAVAVGTALLLGVCIAAPNLPFDDWATRLKAGSTVSDLCAGRGVERVCIQTLVPELEMGDHLVVVADLEDEAFVARIPALNEFAQSGSTALLWVLTDATEEEKDTWYWTHAPSFEVRVAPRSLLRPLYRRLPRGFTVRDGTVRTTHDGIPPLQELPKEP